MSEDDPCLSVFPAKLLRYKLMSDVPFSSQSETVLDGRSCCSDGPY